MRQTPGTQTKTAKQTQAPSFGGTQEDDDASCCGHVLVCRISDPVDEDQVSAMKARPVVRVKPGQEPRSIKCFLAQCPSETGIALPIIPVLLLPQLNLALLSHV